MIQNQAENLRLHLEQILKAIAVAKGDSTTNSRWKKLAPADIAGVMFIGSHNGPKNSELAENIGVGVTTASALVDRLVRRGLVTRTRTEEDRRSVRLSLSDTGKSLYAEAVAEQQVACAQMLETLDKSDRDLFLTSMQKIAHTFSNQNA